jgi:hypothetical protein
MTRYFCGYKKPKIWFENIRTPKNYNRLPQKREVGENKICDLFQKTKPFTIPINEVIKDKAIQFSKEFVNINSDIIKIYWFSDYKNVNIIIVEKNYTTSGSYNGDLFIHKELDDNIFWCAISEQDDKSYNINPPFGHWEDAITIWEKN